MPGADESGELADASIAADILREAGGAPDTVESDRDEQPEADATRTSASRKAKASTPRQPDATEETDETAAEEGDEQPDPEASEGEGEEPESELPEGEKPEGEHSEGEEPEGSAEGEEPEGEEPEGEQPEAEQPKGEQDDDTPEWAKRRFSEYARKVERLEQQLATANAKLSGAQPAVHKPADVEIIQVESPEQLTQMREQAERLEEWAELHANGVEADPEKPDLKPYTAEQVAQVRINARRRLRALDAREKELVDVQRFNAVAHQTYPEFNDPDSDYARALAWVLQEVPEIRRLKNYRMVIGDAIAHDMQRRQQAKQAAQAKKGLNGKPLPGKPTPQVNRKPPVVNGAPARGSSAPSGKFAARQKARERAFRSGSEADIARLVESSLGS